MSPPERSVRGRFITLEGVDGAGKSSHVGAVRAAIEAAGIPVIMTREPGGTDLGERLRDLLLRERMSLAAETLLIFAARAEHLAQVIVPALDRGQWVVSDRFTDSTYAYQGGGRGLGAAAVRVLEDWVHPSLQPDLTLLFDVPPEIGLARRQQALLGLDRFEQEDYAFFERVRAAYLQRAAASAGRIRIIDGARERDEVRVQVLAGIAALVEQAGSPARK